MKGIPIYEANESDFGTNGLGLLYPLSCTVEGMASALYELTIEMPIVQGGKFLLLQPERIIKVSVPVPDAPVVQQQSQANAPGGQEGSDEYEVWRIKQGMAVWLRTKPTSNSKAIDAYSNMAEMKLLNVYSANWYHVQMLQGGEVGYMASRYLEYVRTEGGGGGGGGSGDEGIIPDISRSQLFRIYSVETDTTSGIVIARAMHIFYDLRGNLVNGEYKPNNEPASTVLSYLFSHLMDATDFQLFIGNVSGSVSGDYTYKSFVDCLLGDDGVLNQIDAHLVRDNYNIYVVPNETKDRGVSIKRGKNLAAIAVTYDTSQVITRIIPVGSNANGEPLYISSLYVDSEYITDYPFVRTAKIDFDIKVDKNGDYTTDAAARSALEAKAQSEFDDAHVDLPAYGMEIDFNMLENTVEYAQFAQLQKVFLFDTVSVEDTVINVNSKLNVTAYTWNVLLEKYDTITIGTLLDEGISAYSGGLSTGGTSTIGGGSSTVSRELLDLTSGDNDSPMYKALAHVLDLARASISNGTQASDVVATAIESLANILNPGTI